MGSPRESKKSARSMSNVGARLLRSDPNETCRHTTNFNQRRPARWQAEECKIEGTKMKILYNMINGPIYSYVSFISSIEGTQDSQCKQLA